jgi:hypothetical protein
MNNVRFEMKVAEELLGRVDQWRGGQSDVPNRSEAIRRLIEAGLNTTEESSAASRRRPSGKVSHTDQADKLSARSRKPDVSASDAPTSSPRKPRAKPLAMSKEAQIRALRERDV